MTAAFKATLTTNDEGRWFWLLYDAHDGRLHATGELRSRIETAASSLGVATGSQIELHKSHGAYASAIVIGRPGVVSIERNPAHVQAG